MSLLGDAMIMQQKKGNGEADPNATPTLVRPPGGLWLRKWKILVTDAQDNEALNVSDLHCTFEVHKGMGRDGCYAVARIYNLTAQTENKLVMEGDRLIIEAGYQAKSRKQKTDTDGNPVKDASGKVETEEVDLQYGKIFDGQIIWPSRSRETNVDYVLTLVAIDGDNPLHKNFIAKTVNRGLNARDAINVVANDSEVKTPVNRVSDGLSDQRYPRAKVFFGDPYKYVRDECRGNQASFHIEDGMLNIDRLQDVSSDEALVVTPANGLVGTPQQVQFGVTFKVLLNPAIHLFTKIQIKGVQVNESSSAPTQNAKQVPLDPDWIYQVMTLTHVGDTRGNDWYTEIEGISRYGKGSLPALLANSGQNGMGV